MFRQVVLPRMRSLVSVCLLSLVMVSGEVPQSARAADALEEGTSLGLVPADAAFYVSGLRNREVYDIVVNSRAFAALQEIPVVAMGMGLVQMQMGQFEPMLADYEDLIALAVDMFSHECFVAGTDEYADLIVLANLINSANRAGQIEALQGDADESATMRRVLVALNANLDRLKVPGTLIGFKLSDPERGTAQLALLEQLAQNLPPPFAERFERVELNEGSYLKLSLDGSLVPWDQIPIAAMESEEGEFAALVEALQALKLTICLGMRKDYLLLTLAADTALVEKLGGEESLYTRPEFASLKEFADQRVCGVSYLSQQFAQLVGGGAQPMAQVAQLAETFVPSLPISEELKQEILADVNEAKTDAQDAPSTAGAKMAFSFLTDRGYEGFSYNWDTETPLDGTQPLTLLEHLGGTPLLFIAARAKYAPEDYDTTVAIVQKLYGYYEKYAATELPDDQKQEYEAVRDVVLPILERVHATTAGKLIPAMKDGQCALVLDDKIVSSQWCTKMPAAEVELPFPELAAVCGVSDSKLLKAAGGEYFQAVQDLISKLHELKPDEVPDLQLTAPVVKRYKTRTYYSYPIDELGVDKQLIPNASVADSFVILSYSEPQTIRMHRTTPLEVDSPILQAWKDKPLAAACYLDWAGTIGMLSPWIEFGLRQAMPAGEAMDGDDPGDDDPAEEKTEEDSTEEQGAADGGEEQEEATDEPAEEEEAEEGSDDVEMNAGSGMDADSVIDQVNMGLRILQCLRGYASVTYIQDAATVTHHESHWQDLEEEGDETEETED